MTNASGYCGLHAVVGTVEPCPGGACAFWDTSSDSCVFRDVEHELRGRPSLALHLLELRSALEQSGEAGRSRLSHLLNEEQSAETASGAAARTP